MTKNEGKNKIDINVLIALANIVDNYSDFNKNITNYMGGSKYNRDLLSKLEKLSKENNNLVGSKTKKFYNENKDVIDTINKHTSIYHFISSNYDYHGYPFDDYDKLNYYYNYLFKNKDKIEQIKTLLDEIKKIGFKEIDLNETYDFTKTSYYFLLDWRKRGDKKHYYSNLNYTENIEVLPNYERNTIEYHTTGSNYRIMINEFGEENEDVFYKEIMVNNILFDPNLLPKEITKESTLDKLIKLKKENEKEDQYVRDAIDFSMSIEDLERQFIKTNKTINQIDSINDKKELQKLLIEIFDTIQKIREIEDLHYQKVVEENPKIKEQNLNKEKKLTLDRRYIIQL